MNLYLIDGNSYFYRAYHAIKSLTNSKGLPTNAIYGFTTMMMKVLKEKKPDAVAIAFDTKAPTERHRIYEEYKAHRPDTPDDLITQIPYMKSIVEALNIAAFELPGFEADDIIGTIAKKASSHGMHVFIMSGDKDMMQLVSDRVKIYDPMKDVVIDNTAVLTRFGLPPERIPEVMALTGDTADNIPGVKGVGEKTAKELLQNHSLDELLADTSKIKNERIRKMISENIETAKLSRTLATIDISVPVDFDVFSLKIKTPDWEKLHTMFVELDFKSLLKIIPHTGSQTRGEYFLISDKEELLAFLGKP
ncbi:MAG: hypothetical protein EPN22_09565 [Nitrospirae bacterium]|nr:MAG: hypothetical protein EPN22_09565 [Nitrospirota bacterium]